MEDIYFVISVVSFALAACSLVACIVIFFRSHVIDAIRFLQHKPVKQRGKKRTGIANTPSKGRSAKRSAAPAIKTPRKTVAVDEGSEQPTGLLNADVPMESERPTDMLGDNFASSTEGATSFLVENSENPTDVLLDPSESQTSILSDLSTSESQTSILVDSLESENQTSILADSVASERPTSVLKGVSDELSVREDDRKDFDGDTSAVVQQADTLFRFILIRKELVVHTQEFIA